MRYQVFPMIVYLTSSLLLTEWLDKKEAAGRIGQLLKPNTVIDPYLEQAHV